MRPAPILCLLALASGAAAAARAACEAGLAKDPGNRRFMVGLGRALNKAGDYAGSLRWTEKAAESGYPYAFHAMALHYLYGEGVPKDPDAERRWLEKGREAKVPVSALRLAILELERYELPSFDAEQVRRLLNQATRGRSSSSTWGDFYYSQALRHFYGRYLKAAADFRPGRLPEASDASKRFGRTQTTEFLNLLRSARAHYEDAVPLGPDKARDRRLDDVRNLLSNLDRHYGLR